MRRHADHGRDDHIEEDAGHDRHHEPSADADRRHLTAALIVGFMVAEVTTGVVASSLALISDAGHMRADAVAARGARLVLTPRASGGTWVAPWGGSLRSRCSRRDQQEDFGE